MSETHWDRPVILDVRVDETSGRLRI